jgi:NADH-quinone oxidoreductase subunit N
MVQIQIPQISLAGILPALILCIAGLVALMVGLFVRKGRISASAVICLVGVAVGFIANMPLRTMKEITFNGMLAVDAYSWFFNVLILAAAGLTILISTRYLSDEGLETYEYFVLLLFSSAGMMFMVAGNHLLTIFVGLETLSISVYVLTGILPSSAKARESALKYLLLGAFSSAIFLYGAALLFGSGAGLDLGSIAKYFKAGQVSLMASAGMALLIVGFGFKVAAVPFHMWTPDVYEGAPAPIAGYMSVGVKAAAFATFARVFFEAVGQLPEVWTNILWCLAVLTMILGNLAALVQENIKRMLAYSSIAHAGYILIGMVAGTPEGTSAMLYYLLAYTFTNLGAFAVVALVGRQGEANVMLDDYRGLSRTHPMLAVTMAIFLFSLAGIPPLAGFVGKFAIFKAALGQGYIWLIIIGVLTSAASVFYYFRVVMKMYMEAPATDLPPLEFSPGMVLALVVTAVVVIYIGVCPTTYLGLAVESVKPLF